MTFMGGISTLAYTRPEQEW